MQPTSRSGWLSILAISALTVVGIRLTAMALLPSTHERLVKRYCGQIRALPEDQAARFVSRLAEDDAQWVEVILAATSDDRPLVASAAESALRSLVLRWARLPADESSPPAARLARALMATAENLPPDRRALARSLAEELIVWQVDGRAIDAAQFIADCQAVLLLPVAEPIEVRVAAAPPPRQEMTAPEDGPKLLPLEPPPQPPPAVLIIEPNPPPLATPTSPNEPQLFVPGRSLRIPDE